MGQRFESPWGIVTMSLVEIAMSDELQFNAEAIATN
jgi:hypothetical protein